MVKISPDSFPSIFKEKIIENTKLLSNCWRSPQNSNFQASYQEFYSPDLWLIGPQRKFEKAIAQTIKNAREMVIICSFLLQDTEIIQAALGLAGNVRIYIITASENRLNEANFRKEGLEEERIKDHIKLLEKLKHRCLIRTASHFHAKFVLVDPKNPTHRKGFLSTANLTQHALANNVEMGLRLNDSQVIDLFNLFCTTFWHQSEHELLTQSQLKFTRKISEEEIPLEVTLQHVFSPKASLDFESTLLHLIQQTHGDIYLSTYSIEENNRVFQLIMQELENQRKVFLFVRPRDCLMSTLTILHQAGASIIGHHLLHMKLLIIDETSESKGCIFTGNLTQQSFSESFDIGVFFTVDQIRTILPVLQAWKDRHLLQYVGDLTVNDASLGEYYVWNPNISKIQIEEKKVEDLGDYYGNSTKTYSDFQPSFPLSSEDEFKVREYRKIHFKWRNLPPRLPSQSRRIELTEDEDIPKKILKNLENVELYQNRQNFYLKLISKINENDLRQIVDFFNAKVVV